MDPPGNGCPAESGYSPVVGEMAFFSSGINEFRNVVKSQAEFLFSAALHRERGCFVQSTARFAQDDGQGLERPQSALTPPAALAQS